MSRKILPGVLFAAACATSSPNAGLQLARPISPMEGTFEYVGTLKGQAILSNGRYAFLSGPVDGSAPMTGDAGTYSIVRDTATHRITYATSPQRVGTTYRWTAESWSADTLAYVVMNDAGQVTGRGRAVRRR